MRDAPRPTVLYVHLHTSRLDGDPEGGRGSPRETSSTTARSFFGSFLRLDEADASGGLSFRRTVSTLAADLGKYVASFPALMVWRVPHVISHETAMDGNVLPPRTTGRHRSTS